MRISSSWLRRRLQLWAVAIPVFAVVLGGCSGSPAEPATSVAPTAKGHTSDSEPRVKPGVATAAPPLRTPGLVVEGRVDQRDLAAVLSAAKVARSWVERTWPTQVESAGTVTVRVAKDAAQFTQLRGGPASSGDVVASTTPGGDVILAQTVLGTLTPQGRQIVIAHELTHAILQQTKRTGLPQWVVEGSAEFTAYRFAGVPEPAQTPLLAKAVLAGTAPSEPPRDTPFSGSSVQFAYQQAHGYMNFLVDRYGLNSWRNFVVATGNGSRTAFADSFAGATTTKLRPAYMAFLNTTFGR